MAIVELYIHKETEVGLYGSEMSSRFHVSGPFIVESSQDMPTLARDITGALKSLPGVRYEKVRCVYEPVNKGKPFSEDQQSEFDTLMQKEFTLIKDNRIPPN